MSRIYHKILAIAALALLTLGVGSCVEPLDPALRPDAPKLTFWIYVPGSMQQPVTKALPGDVASVSPESVLQDVQVWVFRHGASETESPLSYADVSSINWSHAGTTPRSWDDCYEMSMPISEDFLKDSDPRVDFYVLANWRSIFSTKPASQTTLAEVRDMIYKQRSGPGYFGTENPTRKVPDYGLPISTIYKGEDGKGVSLKFLKEAYEAGTKPTQQLFKDNLKVIELKRTVSKLRFVISRPEGVEGVSITKIVVNEQLIPFENWVFEKETPILPEPATYGSAVELKGSGTAPLLEASGIGQMKDPEVLTSAWFEENKPTGYAQTAQGYNNFLRDSIAASKATEVVTYLRETDKAISGTVYYKLSRDDDAPEYQGTFTMGNLDNGYNNFRRNHFWTVYAYFEVDGNLYVNPTVADWDDATPLEYTLKLNTNMRLFDSWLYRYDIDRDYTDYKNWATSHMVVSSGRVTEETDVEPIIGRPLRSPQIQLVTTGVGSFDLKVDNPDFELIRVNKDNVGVVTDYEASVNGVLTIAAGDNVYTYFYIVPATRITPTNPPSNPEAKVTLIYYDPVTGPQKVTFNYSSLPGYSDDSSEIWAYYFPADEYKIIYDAGKPDKLRMYYKDYNNPLVPTPVQI